MNRFSVLLLLLIACMTLALVLTLSACSGKDGDEPASTLDKAQLDSVLSESQLPGAATVKGALDLADTAQARADRTEAAADQ